jgi:hypothetical protein
MKRKIFNHFNNKWITEDDSNRVEWSEPISYNDYWKINGRVK